MSRERPLADLLREMQEGKKNGALYISIKEQSEDMARFYFRDGQIYSVRYGSAIGRDCLDILQYYILSSASFYEGIQAADAGAKTLPSTAEIIAQFAKSGQVVRVVGQGFSKS